MTPVAAPLRCETVTGETVPGESMAGETAPGLGRGELLRKLVHIGAGFLAFSLRFLGPLGGALLALAGVVFNAVVLPRLGGRHLWRSSEHDRGSAPGIVFYPAVVLVLVVAFHRHLEVAAAVWGILAFGDGMATVVGKSRGRRRLPWNREKSWLGSAAHFTFGTAAAVVLLLWTAPGRYEPGFAVAAAATAALLAAALESLPQGLDDNLGVPVITGLLLLGLVLSEEGWEELATPQALRRALVGASVNAVTAAAAYLGRSLSLSGAATAFGVGTLVWLGLGWRGFAVLATFFIVASAATQLGYRGKAAARLAEAAGGRRQARHALANGAVAASCAVFAVTTTHPVLFTLAFAGAFASALADTLGSEVGQLLGRRTYLITGLRRVPAGTEGAISVAGTAAGLLGAALLAAVGAGVGLYPPWGAAAVALAGLTGTTADSFLGATLEERRLIDNEATNFLATLAGALVAAGLGALWLG